MDPRRGAGAVAVILLALGCGGAAAKPQGGDGAAGEGVAGAGAGAAAGGAGGTAGAGTGAAGAAGRATGVAGASTVTGCAKSLAGTWDIIVSQFGVGLGTGLLVLTPDTFSLKVANPADPGNPGRSPNGSLDWVGADMAASWRNGFSGHSYMVENTPATVDSGSIPLALGGVWMFTGKAGTCSVQVGVGTISDSCMSNHGDVYVGGGDWPKLVPKLVNGRVYSATRMATAPSSFGDFGGTWVTKADAGMGGTCTITVNGTAFHSDCTVWGIYGKTDLTVSDDCILSGKNPSGHEISGQRR